MPFFESGDLKRKATRKQAACAKCPLMEKKACSEAVVGGNENSDKLIVVNQPANENDQDFAITANRLAKSKKFMGALRMKGMSGEDLIERYMFAAAMRCRLGGINQKSKKFKEVQAKASKATECCRPNIVSVLEKHKPKAILTVSYQATQTVVAHSWGLGHWKRLDDFIPEQIPSQKLNAWIIPVQDHSNWDPDFDDNKSYNTASFDNLGQIEAFYEVKTRPWAQGAPDYASMCENIYAPEVASQAILDMMEDERTEFIAFDYETTTLKPEGDESHIFSVSFSNGYRTIAAPWTAEVREASRKMLTSSHPKIACNMKFEERWTLNEFGHGVTNWVWDTMQAAHWIQQRPGITSIKFSAFAKLGQAEYEKGVSHYFKSTSSLTSNKIRKLDSETLLTYNGMDSLLELLVAYEQMELTMPSFNPRNKFNELRPKPIGS
jgi:uracil-DNA glycosylase